MRGIKHQLLYKNGGVPKSWTGCEEALFWGKVRADQKNKVNRDRSEKNKTEKCKRLPTSSPSILLAIGSPTNVTFRVGSRERVQGAHVQNPSSENELYLHKNKTEIILRSMLSQLASL